MAVLCIDRKNGVKTVTLVDYTTGKKEVLSRRTSGRNAEARQLSQANGIVGTQATLDAARKRDAELGVSINYVKTHEKRNARGEKVCAWRAEFTGRSNKNRWLRAHQRVDYDASYGDPTPGDFAGRYEQECD
jgi:hypothetical protein